VQFRFSGTNRVLGDKPRLRGRQDFPLNCPKSRPYANTYPNTYKFLTPRVVCTVLWAARGLNDYAPGFVRLMR
jgi:hypothetical protein